MMGNTVKKDDKPYVVITQTSRFGYDIEVVIPGEKSWLSRLLGEYTWPATGSRKHAIAKAERKLRKVAREWGYEDNVTILELK
jgi:hypothetical protein